MNRRSSQLQKLKTVATRSPQRYQHAAGIIHDGRMIAWAHNHSNLFSSLEKRLEYHAEARALRKIPPDVDPGDCTLLVIRVNSSGELRNSEPCGSCKHKIEQTGIKKVYYS